MTQKSSVTKKGQVTIPKKIREELGITPSSQVIFEFSKKKKEAVIRPAPDILDIAGSFEVENPVSPLKTREKMEESYERF